VLNEKRPDWFDDASCRGLDIKLFFPERHQPQLIKEARAICAECPVRAECREYSLDLHETYEIFGVWGGWTHRERVNELRGNNRVAARSAYSQTIWNR
jgi:WhiB family redox-sensing transcriptional regulator